MSPHKLQIFDILSDKLAEIVLKAEQDGELGEACAEAMVALCNLMSNVLTLPLKLKRISTPEIETSVSEQITKSIVKISNELRTAVEEVVDTYRSRN